MPCYVCNPQCGQCRPSRPKLTTCIACGKLNSVSFENLKGARCTECGELLDEPEVFSCEFTQRLCQVPCARLRKKGTGGKAQACPWNHAFDLK